MSPVQPASLADASDLAELHACAFEASWSADEISTLLIMPGTFAFQVPGAGFILCRQAADEAEVLTLAIAPEYRRQGLAGRLLDVAIAAAVKVGATAVFLEVAANNTPGLGLYAAAGFIQVGRRRRYYSTASGGIDALILRRGA